MFISVASGEHRASGGMKPLGNPRDFQDWLGCDTCSYTSHLGFVAVSTAGKQLLMSTQSAITNVQGSGHGGMGMRIR